MLITAPVNSFESCVAQINAGATEIFVSYLVWFYYRMSFSSRPQVKKNQKNMPDKAEFKEIVEYAKSRNCEVVLTVNTMFFSDYEIPGIDITREFLDYVEYGIECGIDAVMLCDFGLISLLHEKKYPIKLYASTLLDIDNVGQIKFFENLGISRFVLSYQITYKEILEIKKNTKAEIEVFAISGCSFGCNCMLGHGERFGVLCENYYCVEGSTQPTQLLYSALNCSLCGFWRLSQTGIKAVKIPGREKNYKDIITNTIIVKNAFDLIEESENEKEYINKLNKMLPEWWKLTYCNKNQCKFTKNFTYKSISNLKGFNDD